MSEVPLYAVPMNNPFCPVATFRVYEGQFEFLNHSLLSEDCYKGTSLIKMHPPGTLP
jgi:hypothetical protein